jgi:hypothetical protein
MTLSADGTTTLFAALSVLDGTVIGGCMLRHRHVEFIRFLNTVEREVVADKSIHVVLDNDATHKHRKVLAWLARHPRWSFHFTPISASWLNAVENFFSKMTRQRIRRGVFRSVADLQAAINGVNRVLSGGFSLLDSPIAIFHNQPLLVFSPLMVGVNGIIAVLLPHSAENYPVLVRGRATGLVAGSSKFGGLAAQVITSAPLVPGSATVPKTTLPRAPARTTTAACMPPCPAAAVGCD